MTFNTDPSPAEYRALQLQLLEKMEQKLEIVDGRLITVGERLAKLESNDSKIKDMGTDLSDHEVRLTKIETKGKIETGIVATSVSFVIGIFFIIVEWLLNKPH